MCEVTGTPWQLAICLSRHVITAVESIKQSDCETPHLRNGMTSHSINHYGHDVIDPEVLKMHLVTEQATDCDYNFMS